LIFYGESFHFSRDLRESIWKDNDFILTLSSYNTSGILTPSSHEMRHNPFLGSMKLKTKKMRKRRGRNVESGKYEWEWYSDPLMNYLVATLFPRVTNLLGYNDNHQGEIRQKV
jgi:hypothetical protein